MICHMPFIQAQLILQCSFPHLILVISSHSKLKLQTFIYSFLVIHNGQISRKIMAKALYKMCVENASFCEGIN